MLRIRLEVSDPVTNRLESSMDAARKETPSVQECVIAGILAVAAAASWAWLAWRRQDADMSMTADMGRSAAPFMLAWAVMMAAMMLPTAAPMIMTFDKVQSRTMGPGRFLRTWAFVAGYMLLWTLTGVAAYALASGAEKAATFFAVSSSGAARFGGAILMAAGLYQLTSFKDVCLSTCRTPIAFIMSSWRAGAPGAFRMGWLHGLYCFGCCWLLFAILFPLGMMNIAAMAAITLLIFAEKTLPCGRWSTRAAAAVLLAYGAAAIVVPSLLPTFAAKSTMDMDMSMPMKAGQAMDGAASP